MIKAQDYSSIRDLIVPRILEQQKSNAETQLMAEKIALEKMKCSGVERGGCGAALGTCCCHSAGHRLSPWEFCKGTVLVPAAALSESLTIPNSALLLLLLGILKGCHIPVGLSNFSDCECSQNILGFCVLWTIRLRIIK